MTAKWRLWSFNPQQRPELKAQQNYKVAFPCAFIFLKFVSLLPARWTSRRNGGSVWGSNKTGGQNLSLRVRLWYSSFFAFLFHRFLPRQNVGQSAGRSKETCAREESLHGENESNGISFLFSHDICQIALGKVPRTFSPLLCVSQFYSQDSSLGTPVYFNEMKYRSCGKKKKKVFSKIIKIIVIICATRFYFFPFAKVYFFICIIFTRPFDCWEKSWQWLWLQLINVLGYKIFPSLEKKCTKFANIYWLYSCIY